MLPWELHEPGGVSQVVQNLFDGMQRRAGHRSILLVNTWGQRVPSFATVDGRRTVRALVQSPLSRQRSLRHFASFMFRLPATLLRLKRLVVAEGITHINVHYPGPDAIVWVLVRALVPRRPKLVLSFHGSDVRQARAEEGIGRRLWSTLIAQADDVTACSDLLRNEIAEVFGPAARRTRAIDNGVDPVLIKSLAAIEPAFNLPPRFILSLATIEHKKGLDTLVQAFDTIATHFPDLSLVIAGRAAELDCLARLRAQIDESPHRRRIVVWENLDHREAMRVLGRASMLVLASRQEPFGIVVLEAGVLRVPVVATTACGVVALLETELEAIAVPAEAPATLAAGISRVLSDEAFARRLTTHLHARVIRDFTWDCIVPRYDGPAGR